MSTLVPPQQRPTATTATAVRLRRNSWIATLVMALIVLVPSLWGFSGKFAEFVALYRGDVDGVFAISPIINYLLASLGFFCLFGWAMLQGMFHDIEGPKGTMLETEAWLDEMNHDSTNRSPRN